MALQDEGRTVKFLIHDRDSKFSSPFDEVLRGGGTRIILTPIRAPNANAVCERWVGTVRAECLDWTLVLGLKAPGARPSDLDPPYKEARPALRARASNADEQRTGSDQ